MFIFKQFSSHIKADEPVYALNEKTHILCDMIEKKEKKRTKKINVIRNGSSITDTQRIVVVEHIVVVVIVKIQASKQKIIFFRSLHITRVSIQA